MENKGKKTREKSKPSLCDMNTRALSFDLHWKKVIRCGALMNAGTRVTEINRVKPKKFFARPTIFLLSFCWLDSNQTVCCSNQTVFSVYLTKFYVKIF